LFFGSDTGLLNFAQSPRLATWHHLFFVAMVPLIMMNLLIALMGGSYERVEENNRNAMLRQRAELLVSLETLMSNEDRHNPEYFPRWVHWYCPTEQDDDEDDLQRGVINGVGRKLQAVAKEVVARVDTQSVDSDAKMDQLNADMSTKIDSLSTKVSKMEDMAATQAAKLEELSATLGVVLEVVKHSAAQPGLERDPKQLSQSRPDRSRSRLYRLEPEPEPQPEPEKTLDDDHEKPSDRWQQSASFKAHALRVMTTIDTAFGMLGDLPNLVPVLKNLGARHVDYGAHPEHYDWVGEALVMALQTALGKSVMGADATSAYVVVYTLVKHVMLLGADEKANKSSGKPLPPLPTTEQVDLINSTWTITKDGTGLQNAGSLFFKILFAQHPEALPLFSRFRPRSASVSSSSSSSSQDEEPEPEPQPELQQ